jgi:MFS family permease
MATGTPKIRILLSSNLAILLNTNVADVIRGVTFGSIGGLLGKTICSYLINKFGYFFLMTFSFLFSLVCLFFEFLSPFSMNIYEFYIINMFQGFFAGLIYSGILGYLGEYFSGDKYKKYLTIITGGIGLTGALFGLFLIFFEIEDIIYMLITATSLGLIASFFFFQKTNLKNNITIQTSIMVSQEKLSFWNSFIRLINQKSIFCFSFSFAINLFGSLLILQNTKRLFILFLHTNKYTKLLAYNWLVRCLCFLPLIGGGLFFFLKKSEKNYILISLLLFFLSIFYFLSNNILLCFTLLIISYGLHLILIPVGSDVFMSNQINNKAYYSYMIHTIRSFYTMVFCEINHLINYSFLTFYSLVLIIIILNILSFIIFLLGKKLLYKNKFHKD